MQIKYDIYLYISMFKIVYYYFVCKLRIDFIFYNIYNKQFLYVFFFSF